jgi:hypothetical protein
MRLLALLTIVSILTACGVVGGEPEGGWCYLESGWYLIENDWSVALDKTDETRNDWPRLGLVQDVWDTYQTDDTMQLTTLQMGGFTLAELHAYQDDGYPVCIQYWNETEYHARPLWYHENPGVLIEWAFVAYPAEEG